MTPRIALALVASTALAALLGACGGAARDGTAEVVAPPPAPPVVEPSAPAPVSEPPAPVAEPPAPVAQPPAPPVGAEPPPAAPGGWQQVLNGERATDPAVAVVTGDGVTVVVAGAGGAPRAWVSRDGEDFAEAETPAAVGQRAVLAAAWTGEAFVALGTDYETLRPVVWRSPDGLAWELAEATGLDEPADLYTAISTPSGLVAVGALRVGADLASGSFKPAIWRSADGLAWVRVELPGNAEGAAIGLAMRDDELLAIGSQGRQGALWRSADGGASWQQVALDAFQGTEYSSLSGIAVTADGSIVLTGGTPDDIGNEQPTVLVGDGERFERVELDPELWGGLQHHGGRLTAAHGSVWLAGSGYRSVFSDPDRCYAEPETCETSLPFVLTSKDGRSWAAVELPGAGEATGPASAQSFLLPMLVTDDASGRLLLVQLGEGTMVHAWPDPTTSPPLLPPSSPPAEPELPRAEYGGTIEVGVTYRYPLYIHCGMDVLGQLNGKFWYLDAAAGAAPETGAGELPPEGWPTAGQTILGLVTLVDEDTIEYSIPGGEVIATYAPSDREPPGCA